MRVGVAVSEERAKMTSAAAAIDVVDDNVVDPSNGDCGAVSFKPDPSTSEPASTGASAGSSASCLDRSSSGDSTVRRAAVSALGNNDAQQPAAEVISAPASSVAEEEERESFSQLYLSSSSFISLRYNKPSNMTIHKQDRQ